MGVLYSAEALAIVSGKAVMSSTVVVEGGVWDPESVFAFRTALSCVQEYEYYIQ